MLTCGAFLSFIIWPGVVLDTTETGVHRWSHQTDNLAAGATAGHNFVANLLHGP